MRLPAGLAVWGAVLTGCFSSHTRDAALDALDALDASITEASGDRPDAPLSSSDADGRGGDSPSMGDPCISSLGWRRCAPECRTCPSGHCCGTGFECHAESQVCFPGRGINPCRLARRPTGERERAPAACPSGAACYFDGASDPAEDAVGGCVPVDLCLLPEGEVGPHRCYWGDGEEVVRAPPTDCPGAAWECGRGGGCADCAGPEVCAGTSNDRGFGICTYTMTATCAGDGRALDRTLCIGLSEPPCSCLMPRATAPTTVERFGFVVPRSACREYATFFGEDIECVDIP